MSINNVATPIRLGLMPPLTGIVEIYGADILHAAQIACDEINERGGVLGRPLELIIEDDGSLPDTAVPAARRLIEQHHCVAIIGNLLSNSRIAVANQVAEPKRIPLLSAFHSLIFPFTRAVFRGATFFILPRCPISRSTK